MDEHELVVTADFGPWKRGDIITDADMVREHIDSAHVVRRMRALVTPEVHAAEG